MGLSLSSISHQFSGRRVLDGASVEAAAGEIVCLSGPSGCGKTTLLRLAAGLERVQAGTVSLDGAVLADAARHLPPERRPIGLVFQDFVLFPHLTVAQNVAFGLAGLPADEQRRRVRDELAAVELERLADRHPHQLSGGEQQRAALARAFARRPKALLLDEPFASIDVALRQKLRGEMRRLLKARGAPTILVTHDPSEAIELGDLVAVMREGRIVETASPEALYRAPKTAAGGGLFLGSQTLACVPVDGGIETAFGRVAMERPPDAAFAIVHDGAVAATPDGALSVVDCRFVGPHWSVSLGAGGSVLRAVSATPMAVGGFAGVRFSAHGIRVTAG